MKHVPVNPAHMPYGDHMSEPLSETILRVVPKLSDKNTSMTIQALKDLGPSCFFQTTDNEEQAKGAIRLLEWIEVYLDYKE